MDMEAKANKARPREDIRVLYDYELKNAPGKSIVAVEVDYPARGFTPPHRHSGATVVAVVTEGAILSGMNGNAPKIYKVGENFMEMPGCHHTVSENVSETQRGKMIATMVVDTEVVKSGYENLTVIDAEWR